jgi:hypothetical protein
MSMAEIYRFVMLMFGFLNFGAADRRLCLPAVPVIQVRIGHYNYKEPDHKQLSRNF